MHGAWAWEATSRSTWVMVKELSLGHECCCKDLKKRLEGSHVSCPSVKYAVCSVEEPRYSRAAFLALALDKARHADSVPSILREPLDSLWGAADLEHGCMRVTPGESRGAQGQKRSRTDGVESLSHRDYFVQLWGECAAAAGGRRLPDILQATHIPGMRAQGLWVGRKKAHAILMAARGMMHEELRRSSKDVLIEDLDTQPWQLVVAGASDKIRESLVGPGIKAFRIEMRRKERCPYTKDPMSVFVAERVDGWKVIHHPHAHKDEELRFEDDKNLGSAEAPVV